MHGDTATLEEIQAKGSALTSSGVMPTGAVHAGAASDRIVPPRNSAAYGSDIDGVNRRGPGAGGPLPEQTGADVHDDTFHAMLEDDTLDDD